MSVISTQPLPYTIAFGGVATGSMKAPLAASAAGAARTRGSCPIASATAPSTGRKVAAVAVLLVSSVSRMTVATTAATSSTSGQ